MGRCNASSRDRMTLEIGDGPRVGVSQWSTEILADGPTLAVDTDHFPEVIHPDHAGHGCTRDLCAIQPQSLNARYRAIQRYLRDEAPTTADVPTAALQVDPLTIQPDWIGETSPVALAFSPAWPNGQGTGAIPSARCTPKGIDAEINPLLDDFSIDAKACYRCAANSLPPTGFRGHYAAGMAMQPSVSVGGLTVVLIKRACDNGSSGVMSLPGVTVGNVELCTLYGPT